ncbi:MAG: ABC transporter ATP-binding protein [Actinomycetota bacterium]|nr:ABC transporter ATP-binding protein [Actinomycetota bacterium]
MPCALEAMELYRFYHAGDEETLALRGVSLCVNAGEMVAVTGPSGSGKSTLIACLAGLDEPDGGMVRVEDRPMSRRPEIERARLRAQRVGVLFQSANLVEHLTVTQNVRVAQQLAGRVDRDRIAALLDAVRLTGRAHARPSQLSGGETARAGLAVALANNPAILLADEPTGELDSVNEGLVVDLLTDLVETGSAVVVVTHNDAVAARADRIVALEDGRLAA